MKLIIGRKDKYNGERKPYKKQKYRYHKPKKKLFVVHLPKKLAEMLKQHTDKYEESMSSFITKAVVYQLQSEEPILEGDKNYVTVTILVHRDYDRGIRELAKTNYPTIQSLLRTAILTQLFVEGQEDLREELGPYIPSRSILRPPTKKERW